MIVESAIFAGVSGAVLWTQNEMSKAKQDQKKIEHLFRNAQIFIEKYDNFHKRKIYPKLIRKEKHEWGIDYVYRLPIGIPYNFIRKIEHMINDTLNKEVQTSYDGVLHIRVPNEATPKKVAYKDVMNACKGWEIPMGISPFGLVKHDFSRIPHMTIGGSTNYGKTVLLKVINTTLMRNNPNTVKFHYFDLKGGLEFEKYRKLHQTSSVSDNAEQSKENLQRVEQIMEKRFSLLKTFGVSKMDETSIKDRDFVILDEAAELIPAKSMTKDEKETLQECQKILSRIARLGRAVNVHLIFATQYPTGDILDRAIKQNCDAKVALRVPTSVASRVCIDADGAEELPHGLPGRIIYKTDKFQVAQVPHDEDFYKYVRQFEVNKDDKQHREESETRAEDPIIIG